MICNRCVKQDACKYKSAMEMTEEVFQEEPKLNFVELDCKYRYQATDEQLRKIKERAEYALPTA
jgi:hypothetical protein